MTCVTFFMILTTVSCYDFEDRIARSVLNITEDPFKSSKNLSELSWVSDALKDIAYYLRQHKFNEYDRRYHATGNYYASFPRPPLRSLHWEVHKFCEPSFLLCVEYLIRKIKKTGLKRADDTTIVIQEQQWDKNKHSKQIDAVEKECRKMLKTDDAIADPFEGPIEKFQWRTTASYYMCWYTMNKVEDLRNLTEKSCDNFASCLDPNFGPHNYDPRAYDHLRPFFCALYSFCPDPCCPTKHLKNLEECPNLQENPCFQVNPPGQRICSIGQSRNRDFNNIVLNRWNVTCKCIEKGYEWDPKYGLCVDVDECTTNTHGCDLNREACVNLQGSFRCACRWGYIWDASKNLCVSSPALDVIMSSKPPPETNKTNNRASSLVKKLLNKIREIFKNKKQ